MSAKVNQLIVDRLLEVERFHEETIGWDASPSLWVIIAKDTYGSILEPMVVPVDIAHLVDDPRPYMGMYALAEAGMPWPPNVRALLFACEGWMVQGTGREEIEAALALTAERNLSSHPERKEVRIMQALDHRGRVYTVNRVRGEMPVVWSGLDDDPDEIDGNVLDALRALGKVVMG